MYGAQTLDISNVWYWVREAKRDWITLLDVTRLGRPELRKMPEVRAQIENKIQVNRRITQRELNSEGVGVSIDQGNKMIKDLDYHCLCAK